MLHAVGKFGYGQQAAYCASKGALLPLAKSLALAWAADGINVNVVLPGAINTPFTKVRSKLWPLQWSEMRVALQLHMLRAVSCRWS